MSGTTIEKANGFLGTLGSLGEEAASRPLTPGDPLTSASHAAHLRFARDLASRSLRGENAYSGVRLARSWDVRSVTATEWSELLRGLRSSYASLREAIVPAD